MSLLFLSVLSGNIAAVAHREVSAGVTLLASYVRTPATGLCELIWNAYDEDAKTVTIEVDRGDLGGVDQIRVEDDGGGMTYERADRAFSRAGDSYKLMPGTLSPAGRPVHGRYGRGRFAAFALGNAVSWISTAPKVDGGEMGSIQVSANRASLAGFEIDELQTLDRSAPGTRVLIGNLSPDTVSALDEVSGLRQRVMTEFALHLDRYADFKINFLGENIEPTAVIADRAQIKLPSEGDSRPVLTIIEWTLPDVERRLYLCAADGTVIEEMPPNIQAVGAQFTAYIAWDGFPRDAPLKLEGDDTPTGRVIESARSALRKHLAESIRRREAAVVKRWEAEGVWPYKGAPKTPVERATRDAFKLVAMASSRTVDESRSHHAKALALTLLKETFESDPERLLPILHQFAQLPMARIDELRTVLERTTLSQLISLGREVGNRIEFVTGLNSLLFDRRTKKLLLERRQLHRMLAHETWIFGDQWTLTGDDDRLTEVLKKYLAKLGKDVELATARPVLREDGSDAIPDLVLGRQLETRENHYSNLVIELKRPDHKLDDDDVTQVRSYASAIVNDERFDQPNTSWEFWLIGNETKKSVNEAREQDNLPYGVVQNSKRYKIIVKTWAEVISDANHRLKFVQKSLQFESNRDTGLKHMRTTYAAYLPAEEVDEARQEPPGVAS